MAAYTTINKPSLYFNTKLYTGNGGTNAQTGVGFQPDWVWIKSRSDTSNHRIYDAVRGGTKTLYSNLTNAQGTNADAITSFDSDGFTLGANAQSNGNGLTLASWCWKAGTGQGSSNTDGSINTTYTSVNTTAGFSISQYTGTGNAGTVGHGLGVAPKVIIIKNISQDTDWVFGHQELDASAPWTKYLELNSNVAVLDNTVFNDTAPTNSVFSVGGDGKVSSGSGSHVAYCFADVRGYSKFGKYKGNGNADGPFIYTGFKPAFVISKNISTTMHWSMNDTKRDPFNVGSKRLWPSQSNAEVTNSAYYIDYLSNGFKIRSDSSSWNGSGNTMIYMAFAENPLVDSTGNIPATAR
jgi:hypothetical protein